MSGIYIKGMEMPTNCYRCLFFRMTTIWNKDDELDDLFRCVRTGEESWEYRGGYLPNCPLIPVPDHGRLIDADEIPYNKIMLEDDEFYYGVTKPYIDRMPTIIPAKEDKGEQ